MSSLVERLRVRSDSRPRYSLDESDDEADLLHGKSKKPEQFEKIVRDDAKEESCHACGESGNLLICETCTYEYHPKCLLPPLKAPLPTSWRCPKCVNPLNDIEKILDCEIRPTVADDSDASKLGSKQIFVKQYLVKWKGLSYLHCTCHLYFRVPEKEFIKAYKELPRLRTKVNNFRKQMPVGSNSEDDFVPIRPEYTMVERILACRQDDEKEYLVKWVGLNYDECYWESESDILSFQQQIENFNRLQSRYRKLRKQKSNNRDATDSKKRLKDFQQFEKSPEFLPGGELHPYQLEGLNFLRFSWSKQTHVILADEMGLGKTIQSIAFLASLYEENVSPHIVVAPLSTLRNWEREFATWAPHMYVVMYVGTAASRAVIREYEFYFPKSHKKDKKKKSSHGTSESKQERIKFDVLLTSYEMINIDNGSLKTINWETMIVDEGHRLKNKDSKLFSSLKQFNTRHRTLLTGTPLQNNLDELFMLMHFLDAGKFSSLEEFQEEFKDINQEEQVSRLHKMLAPHLVRIVRFSDVRPNVDFLEKIERFLRFSIEERSFFARPQEDDDVIEIDASEVKREHSREEEQEEEREEKKREEMAGGSPAKVTSAAAKRAAQAELARKGREKRKAPSTTGSGAKRTKMSIPREPPSKSGDSSKITGPEKTKTPPGVIEAEPVSSAPPKTTSTPPTATSAPSSVDKGKGKAEEVMTVNFTLPSDFMADNVLDRAKIFPRLGKYLLPTFQERFKDVSVDDVGSNIAGLSFMSFQASLCLYSQMERIRRLVPKALEKEKAALEKERVVLARVETLSVRLDDAFNSLEVAGHEKDELKARLQEALVLSATSKAKAEKTKESLAATEKEAGDLKSKLTEVESEVRELSEELKSIEAFSRLTARAALMRQHLTGKNPLATASEELAYYLSSIGTERDLDSDDDKEADEAEADEAPIGGTSEVAADQAKGPQV